jgi:ketose-bisphosphate aldolase
MSVLNTEGFLKHATEQRYALCVYNVDTLDYIRAVVEAAEEEKAPIIIETVEQAIEAMGLKCFSRVARQMAEEASVPIGIHLDHGNSFDWVKACLDVGFTSVMIDASHKPLKDNVLITRKVVQLAEKYGAFTEGEIGHVPGIEERSGGPQSHLVYTEPEEAAAYCRESGVHSLAVSIGTVHYMKKQPLKLDLHLLDRIRSAVRVPLVLNGGAAVTDRFPHWRIPSFRS